MNPDPPQLPHAALLPPDWQAGLVAIYISPGHDYWGKHGEGRLPNGITSPDQVECVAGMGLRGDRYFGYRPDYKGQATFFSSEIVDEVREHFKLPRLPASVFRRNLIVRGVDLKQWMGKRFRFQGVEFEGCQECRPCRWMDRVIAPGGEDFLKGNFRGGLRAKIVGSGILRVDRLPFTS
ncbi:MAG: MOSC domain-containing protein [Luteolibacter sp.]